MRTYNVKVSSDNTLPPADNTISAGGNVFNININQESSASQSSLRTFFDILKTFFKLIIVAFILYMVFVGYKQWSKAGVDWDQWREEIIDDYWYYVAPFMPDTVIDYTTTAVVYNPQRLDPIPIPKTLSGNCYLNETPCPPWKRNSNHGQKKQAIDYVEFKARAAGLPNGFLATMLHIESFYNPRAEYCGKNGCLDVGAKGWFQYIGPTMDSKGVDRSKRFDYKWSTNEAIKDALFHREKLAKDLGIVITEKNMHLLYLPHNQGLCGIKEIISLSKGNMFGKGCNKISKKTLYINMLSNTNRKWRRIIRKQKVANKEAALAFLSYRDYRWKKSYESMRRFAAL